MSFTVLPNKTPFVSHLSALSEDSWFAALSPELRQALLLNATSVHLVAGEMLFRRGDAPSGFYALLKGNIKMSTLSEDGREGILTILEPSTWFGEISLIDGQPRTHDATAVGIVELLLVTPLCFSALMRDPVFATAIAHMLAYRIRLLYGIVEDAHLRSPRARVARRLLLLAGSNTMHTSASHNCVPVSQESLAMMLGMSRQTLSKELKFLSQQRVIALKYRAINIISATALSDYSDQH
ncbi:Crp/Fnr family transcriptional regulator [Undibacterium sp. RuRC25W]|uniref:Crp/Fnr family transcriptional regulator n=1 Tax=Undibacterium sp. RuRC25W TaxID=3413047 RepID=UPI003BEFF490